MKTMAKKTSHCLVLCLAILVFLSALLWLVQPSLARYASSFGEQMHFTVSGKGEISVTPAEWTDTDGGKTLPFSVTASGEVRVRVFVPAGVQPRIALLAEGGKKYTAVITPLSEGTAVYRTLGAGSVCCFYDERGRELVRDARAGGLAATLTLMGDGLNTEGVRVLAEPAKIN